MKKTSSNQLHFCNYKHITNGNLRRVLKGDVSEDALCQAITYSNLAANADIRNLNIPSEVASFRKQKAVEASVAWNTDGDAFAAVQALREQWGSK